MEQAEQIERASGVAGGRQGEGAGDALPGPRSANTNFGPQIAAGPPVTEIAEILRRQAEQRPHADAILAAGRNPLTYAGLAGLFADIRGQLRAFGIGPADRVALVLPNGAELAACFLCVAGVATAAPLNPAYRRGEFDFYLSDLRAKALIVEEGVPSEAREAAREAGILIVELRPSLPDAGIFTLAADHATLAAEHATLAAEHAGTIQRPVGTRDADVALVLHTSGTTSRPKIVPLSQANLCLSARNIAQWLQLDSHDRCLNVMPLFHIHGLIGAVLSTLSAGGSVVCSRGFDATRFLDELDNHRPTWYTAVPTMHQAVLAAVAAGGTARPGESLRLIRSCSSALPPSVLARLEEVFRVPVVEAYGMTEAAHQMTCNPLPPGLPKPGSVGLPTGVDVAIMDHAGQRLPTGVEGEVVIRGPNVTAGYEHNPAANAEAFTDGWFRTGDRGRIDEDGYLFLTGRIKELINRGGEKISPREIDDVLLTHAGIAQAMAFAVPHASLGEEVAAAVVLNAGHALDAAEVQQHAASRLAEFKVPRHVVFVTEIPKGPTGKPRRIGLAEKLGLTGAAVAAAATEPAGPPSDTERRLGDIWCRLLATTNVRRTDGFFDRGGNSLTATMLVALVEREFRVALPIRAVFASETLAEMAAAIDRSPPLTNDHARRFESVVPFQTEGTRPAFFMVHGHSGRSIGLGLIAPHLDADQPYYGFVARGMDGRNVPDRAIPEFAARYLREMREVQPRGPYYLGGFCSGGMVAYEMAQQLFQAGERVALLALLDTAHPSRFADPPWWLQSARNAKLCVRRTLMWIRLALGRPASTRLGERIVNETLRRGAGLYRPAPYPGRITLIRSEIHARSTEPYLGWDGTASAGIDLRRIAGDHSLLFTRDHIGPAARELQTCLREAQHAGLRDAVAKEAVTKEAVAKEPAQPARRSRPRAA